MERKTKESIFGAVIIISLVVIFIPYMLNGQLRVGGGNTTIPDSPIWPEPNKLVSQPKEMQDLKKQELKSKDMHAMTEQHKTWVVRIGGFSSSQEAEQSVKMLRDKKLPAYVKVDLSSQSTPQYWVLLGPTLQKQEAMKMIKQLKQDKIEAELNSYHPNMALD